MKRNIDDDRKPSILTGWWHLVFILFLSGILLLGVRTFLFTQVEVQDHREELGLLAGDHVIVNRMSYGVRLPFARWWGYHRLGNCQLSVGDMVAYDFPDGSGRVSLDRVIGLPGDTLWIDENPDIFTVVQAGAFGIGTIIVPEECIIGRPVCVSYSVNDGKPFYSMLRPKRLFVKIR